MKKVIVISLSVLFLCTLYRLEAQSGSISSGWQTNTNLGTIPVTSIYNITYSVHDVQRRSIYTLMKAGNSSQSRVYRYDLNTAKWNELTTFRDKANIRYVATSNAMGTGVFISNRGATHFCYNPANNQTYDISKLPNMDFGYDLATFNGSTLFIPAYFLVNGKRKSQVIVYRDVTKNARWQVLLLGSEVNKLVNNTAKGFFELVPMGNGYLYRFHNTLGQSEFMWVKLNATSAKISIGPTKLVKNVKGYNLWYYQAFGGNYFLCARKAPAGNYYRPAIFQIDRDGNFIKRTDGWGLLSNQVLPISVVSNGVVSRSYPVVYNSLRQLVYHKAEHYESKTALQIGAFRIQKGDYFLHGNMLWKVEKQNNKLVVYQKSPQTN